MTSFPRMRIARAWLLGLGLLVLAFPLAAQVTPDQAAEMILNSARKAYNEKTYPVAVARFREFLAKFGNHKDAPMARYGLALSLVEGPDKDHAGALEQLQPLAGAKDFPEHPYVLYYLGVAQRGLGVKALADAAAKPQEAPQHRAAANGRFEEASKQFTAAVAAFTARVKEPPPEDVKVLPIDLEWAARARCDLAEMQIRTLKNKEAQGTTAFFVKGSPLVVSKSRGLGLYYHGFASFLMQDYNQAGKALSLLTPFTDPVYGTHARYLLGRIHHLADERVEAATHYEAVLADYAKSKQGAVERLKQPDLAKDFPEEKARLEALVKDPVPDHVARSNFYLGVLQYEAGKFADALARFAGFAQQHPGSPLLIEAQLRQGFCQVQLKDFPNAFKTLQPLVDKEPRLSDQALLWVAKAQAGSADSTKPDQYKAVLTTAIDSFRKAAEKSQQLAASDPEAKTRRGEILLEMADTQQLLGQHKEAAAVYDQVINEKLLPQRDEEVLLRRISALHLAGDYPVSDQNVARFQQAYPRSPLLPAVLFRFAENAYFSALAAEKIPDVNARAKEVARLLDEAGKRYQVVIDKYPEYTHVGLARYGLGMVLYKKGDYERAKEVLETVPAADRRGDLAATPYLLADCLMRLAPAKADDALAAGRLQEQLQQAIELLDAFSAGDPKGNLTPDALLKLGLCYTRMAAVLAQPPEKAKTLQSARATYEKLMQQFPQHPLQSQAFFERAKVMALAGDKGGAMNQLRNFANDPLRAAPVAPMAMLNLANLLREQNKAEEAAKLLADTRQQHEANLAKDPERAGWITLLGYHQGVALREAGKLAEARTVFDQVAKQGGNRPAAFDALLRLGQCQQQEGMQKIDAARKRLATPNLKPEEHAAATKSLQEGFKTVQDAVGFFETQAVQLKQKQAPPEPIARMHYEAAWGYRLLAGPEVTAVRGKLQQDLLKKKQDEALKKDPNYKPPAVISLPDVPLSQVPVQPLEQKARAQYQALITGYGDQPLALEARFELAELLSERADYPAALQLLNQAMDKEPSPALAEKVRLRIADCQVAKKDYKAALSQLDQIVQNPKSSVAPQAHYRAGECLIFMGDNAKAAARLAIFRDQGPFQNVPGVSDKALLRLGHALAALNQWDQSRQAYEVLLGRFGNSPWIHEARYGIAWTMQNKKDYDNAVNIYNQVVAATATEVGARAQLQIGLCRLEQKKHGEAAAAFLTVPFTYDYPELSAAALCEAARTYAEIKQKEQAERLLQRVLRDHAQSKWADVAKERLEALKKS